MALIFIIEDEKKIAEILSDYLLKNGFQTKLMFSGEQAFEQILADKPDLVIMDIMLPVVSGFDICRRLRAANNQVPIIMLTARVSEADRLEGLNMGADDYVCKPFLPNEVVARVQAILRRIAPRDIESDAANILNYRNIRLDMDNFSCIVNDRNVELTPVEAKLLQTMINRPGRVFSRDTLIDLCYDDHRIISDRTIDSHMRNLRKKIQGSEGAIQTIYGAGYKFE